MVQIADLGYECVAELGVGVEGVAIEEDVGVDFIGCEVGEEAVVEH